MAPRRLVAFISTMTVLGVTVACLDTSVTALPEAQDLVTHPASQDSTAEMPDTVARVRILLTDAPADYIGAAIVDIGQVSLIPAGEGSAIVLSEDGTDGFVDLLDFQGAATTPLAEADIDPGDFTQIRMIIEAARVQLAEGYAFRDGTTEMELTVPSGAQSGLKLNLHNEEEGGAVAIAPGETVLVLDFDVNQSFVLRGNPDTPAGVHGVNFKPAIRVTAMDVAASMSGEVTTEDEGVSVAGLTVTATPADQGSVEGYQTFIGTALTADDGSYTIHYLVPGTYEVAVEVGEGVATEPEVHTVVLAASENATGADFALIDVTGSIAGTVSTIVEGVSVAGLAVQAQPDIEGAEALDAETTDDGSYSFGHVLAGSYVVTVSLDEGVATDPEVAEVEVGEQEDVSGVDFEVLDVTGSIAGRVSTALAGESVEGLAVSLQTDVEGAEAVVATTAAGGSYLAEGLLPGIYLVTVAAGEDRVTEPAAIEVELGAQEEAVEVDFVVVEDLTGSISGTVTTSLEGLAVEGFVVSAVSDAEGAEAITTEVGADGTYTLESLTAGNYLVTVLVGDGLATDPASRTVELEADGAVEDADFEVVAGG